MEYYLLTQSSKMIELIIYHISQKTMKLSARSFNHLPHKNQKNYQLKKLFNYFPHEVLKLPYGKKLFAEENFAEFIFAIEDLKKSRLTNLGILFASSC